MSVTDLHISHTIANGVKYYVDNRVEFEALFFDVAASLRDSYYNKLASLDIKFDVALRKRHEKFPLITISIDEKSADTFQPLGNRGFQGELSLLVNQDCDLNIYSDDLDAMRVLQRTIQSSMLIFKKNFLAMGYLNMQFISSTSLDIEDDVITSNVDVYGRSLRYRAQRQINAKPPEVAFNLPWELNSTIVEN